MLEVCWKVSLGIEAFVLVACKMYATTMPFKGSHNKTIVVYIVGVEEKKYENYIKIAVKQGKVPKNASFWVRNL